MHDDNVTWLGNIAWYSIGNHLPITADQLSLWAEECGLFLVSKPTPRTADAFKTATTAAGAEYGLSEGVTAKLAFQQVRSTEEVVTRNLMLTVIDRRAGTSSVEKVAEMKFQRPVRTNTGRRAGSERLKERIAPGLAPVHTEQVERVIAAVHHDYAQRTAYLAEGTLRKAIRDVIDVRLLGLPLRRSGVYFVLPEHLVQLQALGAFVRRMGPACDLHYLPLVDDPKQRRLLQESLAAETVQLAEAVDSTVTAGPLPAHMRATLTQRLAEQQAKVATLEQRFGSSGLATRAALAQAGEALELPVGAGALR